MARVPAGRTGSHLASSEKVYDGGDKGLGPGEVLRLPGLDGHGCDSDAQVLLGDRGPAPPRNGMGCGAGAEAGRDGSSEDGAGSDSATHEGKSGGSCGAAATGEGRQGRASAEVTGADDDPATVDERRQKRMLSNRESARRSRLRKQQRLDILREQATNLQTEKSDMMTKYNIAARHLRQLSEENRGLRSHAMELSQRLQRLHHEAASHGIHDVLLPALPSSHQHHSMDHMATGGFSSQGHMGGGSSSMMQYQQQQQQQQQQQRMMAHHMQMTSRLMDMGPATSSFFHSSGYQSLPVLPETATR
eukprot:TRINITY_DN2234_c0_g1_i1.p1 TRINITY_DN2234_c0_g1~~TRINITY_DN2234_c0_g1_i1.p1  ORF type:complete len:304 (-),score=81.91 TRINITY_DN2234_c0_g1_i1:1289-2200(-)